MRAPWYVPVGLAFLALVGLGVLGLLWLLGTLVLAVASLGLAYRHIRRLFRPSWRRLLPP